MYVWSTTSPETRRVVACVVRAECGYYSRMNILGSTGIAQGHSRLSGRARELAGAEPMNWAARAGLTARGAVYLLIGLLALLVAQGHRAAVDQKGALAQVLAKPYGGWVVGLLAVGFALYALWRLSEAAFGVAGEGRKAGPRVQSLVRGLAYLFLAYTAVSLIQGSRQGQSAQQKGWTAQTMAHPGGRWIVLIVGAAVVVVGLVMVGEGVRLKFMRYFPAGAIPDRARNAVKQLGRIGTVARGLVFALAGALTVAAAWTYDPSKAAGLDGALKTLRDQPYGPYLLGAAGLGLIAFGVYGLAEARYRRV